MWPAWFVTVSFDRTNGKTFDFFTLHTIISILSYVFVVDMLSLLRSPSLSYCPLDGT